jgi:methyl-accepting chemotaxis protein
MKKRLVIILSIFSVFPLLVFAIFSLNSIQKISIKNAEQISLSNTYLIKQEVGSLIDKDVSVLKTIAINPTVQEYSQNAQGAQHAEIKMILQNTNKINPEIHPVVLDNANGDPVAKNDDTPLANVSDRDYFKEIVNGKDSAISSVIIGKGNGHPMVVLATPVHNQENKMTGVVQGAIDLDKLNQFITQFSGNGRTAFIIDSHGKVVAHPNKDMNQKDLSEEGYIQNGLQGKEGTYVSDVNGTKMMTSYVQDKQTGWVICNQIPYASVMGEFNSLFKSSITLLIIVLVIACIVGYWMARQISNPLVQITRISKQMAEGDLTEEGLNVKSKDELYYLAESFNCMGRNLRDLIRHVGITTDQVAVSSEELMASAEQTSKATEQISIAAQEVATGTERQVQSANEATQVVAEISKGMDQVSSSIQSVADATVRANQETVKGNQVVRQTVEQMNIVYDKVESTAQVVNTLGERSKEIGQIVSLITEISNQTNLLALNAAIEAARAGEHGRGFAVVADEVRKLAEQSGTAAGKIRNLILDIQTETQNAVLAMNEGTQAVEEGIKQVHQTGESFKSITQMIEEVSAQSQEVSAIVEEVNASAQGMVEVMETVAHISEQSSNNTQNMAAASEEQLASMDEISSSATSLAKMAADLQVLISRFKV